MSEGTAHTSLLEKNMRGYGLIFGCVPVKFYVKKVRIGWISIARTPGDKSYDREWTLFKPEFILD